jgi:adenosine deaminase
VLRTEADFRDLALAYFDRAAADNVVHAEIFFDPQTHTDRGIRFDIVMKGLLAGMDEAEAKHGLTSKLILCFLRHLDEEAAFATLARPSPGSTGSRRSGSIPRSSATRRRSSPGSSPPPPSGV